MRIKHVSRASITATLAASAAGQPPVELSGRAASASPASAN